MKNNYNSSRTSQFSVKKSLFTIMVLLLTTIVGNAQVNVNPGAGSYTTLKAAFDAINLGTHTGAITIDIVGDTSESASAILNASGVGAASYVSINISPSGGATRTISGAIVGNLIDLNGADNVTINGLGTGGNSLVLNNTSTGIASTLRFVGDASNNIVQNTTLLGGSSSVVSGTVFFSTGTVTGNDGNMITACTFGGSGANFASTAVYSGGTATVGIENSGNTVSNCRIADFFSATLINYGVFVSTGSTDWTISGNKFYQTASRTYTTGNTHSVIQISTGNNHVVSNNIIGFANAAGTGTYTMLGTIATRFIGIGLAVGTTTASSVQGNTFTAISLATSSGAATTNGVLCGINVTSGSVNIGNVSGNIIGGSTGTNLLVVLSTTTQAAVVGIHSSSTGAHLISGNTMGGFASQSATATVAGTITGINISSTPSALSIINNVIGNSTANNMIAGVLATTTGSSLTSGINLSGGMTISTTITGNTIQNLSSYGTGTTGYVRGIWTGLSGASTHNISNNTLSNLLTNNANTSLSNGQLGTIGIFIGTGTAPIINNNTITNVSNLNSGAVSTNVAGISHAVSSNAVISKNKIYSINNASTAISTTLPGLACGVFVRGGANNLSIYNNMISLGIGQTSNTSFVGVIIYSGGGAPTVTQVFYNTIYIGGTATSGAQPTMCVYRGNYSTTAVTFPVDIRNNILENARTGGTGSHYAIANNYGATPSTTGWATNASNYNVLNANATTVGWWTTAQSFTGWKTASASDNASLSAVTVNFLNAATGDLHLNMGVTPTQLESGGVLIGGVTTDYDNQTRPGPAGSVNGGAFAPDLGADEFDGVILDLSSPTISYTPLVYTCDGSVNRTLTTSITDASGVTTSGVGLPVLYWKINAGTWTSVTGTYVSGSTYTFSFGAGAILNDVVSYYIVAQDNVGTPNIGAFPSVGATGFTANPPGATTPPTTPSSYTINNTLTGTYTVGVTGAYPTLTAAVAAYNVSCLSGPVTFSLIDATYPSETYPISINQNVDASAVNTLTIKPAVGVSPTISGTSTSSIINLNGADYVTIDGGDGTGTNSICPRSNATRALAIIQTNVATTAAVVSLQTTATGDAATNNKVMNCNIVGNANTTTLIGVNISGTAIGGGAGGTGNHNNQVVNNSIQKVQYGIFSSGASIAIKNQNNIFNLNNLTGAGANSIGIGGIVVVFEDGATLQGNNIANMVSAASADVIGISLGATAAVNTLTASAEVTNVVVSYNTINNLVQSNTFSAVGINMAASATGTNTVANNVITNIFSNGTSGDFAAGIYYGGGAGALRVYYNTIRVSGATLTGGSQPNFALAINGVTPNVDVQNNILMCTSENGANSNTGIGLAYTSTVGNYANLISNNNDIFVSGTTGAVIGRVGSLTAGTTKATLADWQTETGRDGVSLNTNPVFVSGTDFHLVGGDPANVALSSGGTPISVTTDFDCVARSATTPTIGAYENTFLAINQFESTNGFKAYPNPVSNILNIEYTSDLTNVFVYNMLGQQVLSRKVTATSTQIDMSGLNAGTYLVKVEAGTVSKTLKVFKR